METRTLLSIAPLTATTQSVTSSGASATVQYSVFDPVKNAVVAGSTSYNAASGPAWTISGLSASGGIVTWRFRQHDAQTGTGTGNNTETDGVGYAVYDPIAGRWQSGQKSYTEPQSTTTAWTISAVQVASGVVAWGARTQSLVQNAALTVEIDYGTYDPAASAWKFSTRKMDYATSNYTWDYTLSTVASGLVSWRESSVYNGFTNFVAAGFAAYNPSAHAWDFSTDPYSWSNSNSTDGSYSISPISIAGQSVNYVVTRYNNLGVPVSSTSHTKGYIASSRNWYEGATKPYDYFFAAISSTQPGLSLWFIDESLGATSWSWNFGDGASATAQSGVHVFAHPGGYGVTETVVGPAGNSARSQTFATAVPAWLSPAAGALFQLADNTLGVTSGTVTLLSDPAVTNVGLSVNATGAAKLVINKTVHLGAVSIGNAAVIGMAAGGAKVLRLTALSIGAAAALDLNDNDLLLDYTGAAQGGAIYGLIKSGQAGGAWNGPGIRSSAAANNVGHNTALGSMEATNYEQVSRAATFDGEPLDSTAVVVKFTLKGDATLDGLVDFSDLVILAQNYNQTGKTFSQGNFDYSADGTVDFNDLVILAQHYDASALSITPTDRPGTRHKRIALSVA